MDYRLIDGTPTTKDDDERIVWYAASGRCGYWTDDWSKLATNEGNGIPICPHCGCVGMQVTAGNWLKGAEWYETHGQPRYREYLAFSKERCCLEINSSFIDEYSAFLKTSV